MDFNKLISTLVNFNELHSTLMYFNELYSTLMDCNEIYSILLHFEKLYSTMMGFKVLSRSYRTVMKLKGLTILDFKKLYGIKGIFTYLTVL